ncbi:MAG: ATP-binding protein [Bacteroidales bacterium]
MEENQIVEWKESWRDEYLKWICGFANAQGGTLVIGKNDKGKPVGLANSKTLLEDIPNKIKSILGIVATVDLKTADGQDFIEIHVDAYPYPISYKGQYHFRSGSTKQELSGNALNTFLLKKYGLHWDAVPVPYLTLEMLEPAAFKLFVQKAVKSKRLGEEVLQESHKSILTKLQLLEGTHLKRAASLLFHDNPEEFVTGAYIKIGFFRTNTDLVYQDEIHGNLFQQVDKTLDLLLTKYMKAYISYEGLQRIERYLFPAPALREALLNAVVHKDYASANPIQISVYETKIIFWNAGKLPEELPIAKLKSKHPSIPFNPLIAAAFFRAGYIETWGRGIEKIMEECTLANAPIPEFNSDYTGLMVIFDAGNIENLKKTPEETREKGSEKIIELIEANNFITISELAEFLGVTTRTIERKIKKLQTENKIRRVGSDKTGHWILS